MLSLKPSNLYGYDEIFTKILKTCAQFIISPFTYIRNQSLSTGVFPSWLKYSVGRPLFKKGNKNDMSNYRPISLLTPFSKIFEKLMYGRIYQHPIDNNILIDEQYGFRTNSSPVKAMRELLNAILNALNNKNVVGGIFSELHKAFDCVNHKILLAKMKFYGITGKFLTLIKSYLEDRYQKVSIHSNTHSDNISSDWKIITHGVSRGSILGPLLFLIYFNDLPTVLIHNAFPILFTDYTSIIVTDSNIVGFQFHIKVLFE
jgi:hypothetical protein